MHDIDLAFCELTMDAFANRGGRQRRAALEYIQNYWNQSLRSNPTDRISLNGSEHWFELMVRDIETKGDNRLVEKMQLLRKLSYNVAKSKYLKTISTKAWLESRVMLQNTHNG